MVRAFWINHQRFLLICGSGLVAFLLLNSFVTSFTEGAEKRYRACRDLQARIRRLHKGLATTYSAEVRRAEACAGHEESLAADVCLPPDRNPEGDAAGRLQFSKRIDQVWESVRAAANRRGLMLPKKLTTADFGIGTADRPEDYAVYQSYLEIVGRGLEALVNSGMTRIDTPELVPPEATRVAGSEGSRCLYRGVSFAVRGPYEAFVGALVKGQVEGKYLQVRLREMRPVSTRAEEQEELRGALEFFTFRLEEETVEGVVPATAGEAGGDERVR